MAAQTFQSWWAANLPGVKHFTPAEFLMKGAANATNGLNTNPPRELWPNVIPLVLLLDELRERLGHPIVFTSVYRSPAYNKAVGGENASFHMQFKAADFSVVGLGEPADWAMTLAAMRANGLFTGGIGIYDTFVHVDVRGTAADWDKREGPRETGRVLFGPPPVAPAVRPQVRGQPDDPGPEPQAPTTGNRGTTAGVGLGGLTAAGVAVVGSESNPGLLWLAAVILIVTALAVTRKWWWPMLRRMWRKRWSGS